MVVFDYSMKDAVGFECKECLGQDTCLRLYKLPTEMASLPPFDATTNSMHGSSTCMYDPSMVVERSHFETRQPKKHGWRLFPKQFFYEETSGTTSATACASSSAATTTTISDDEWYQANTCFSCNACKRAWALSNVHPTFSVYVDNSILSTRRMCARFECPNDKCVITLTIHDLAIPETADMNLR